MTAPGGPPASLPSLLSRPRRGLWTVLALANVTLTWLSYMLLGRHGEDTQSWFPPVAGLALAAAGWPLVANRKWRAVTAIALVFVTTGALGGVLSGQPILPSVHLSLVSLAISGLFVATWQRLKSGPGLAPGGARDVVTLNLLLAGAAALTILAGGAPTGPGVGAGRSELLWFIRITSNLIVAAPFILVVWLGRDAPILPRARPTRGNVAMGLLSLACLVVPYLVPKAPLGWAIFIPVIWAGLTLAPRTVAGLILIAPAATLVGALLPYGRQRSDAFIPPSTMMQALAATVASVALLIAYQRVDNTRLTQLLGAQHAAAQAQNAVLTGIFRGMREGLLLATGDGRITLANPSARTLLGHRMPTTLDPAAWLRAFRFTTVGSTAPLDTGTLRNFLQPRSGASATLTVTVEAPGRKATLAMVNEPLPAKGAAAQRVILMRDVTANQERQQHLKAFAATVAHDLKNPLTSVLLWMDTAEASLGDEHIGEAVDAVRQACDAAVRMNRLIDDYLAYTVSREGVSRPAPLLLAPILDEMSAGDDPGRVVLTNAAPHAVTADDTLLRQLLGNLIDNAMKYARPGGPARILVTSERDHERPGWVVVRVADEGIGLRPGTETRIFDAFARSHRDLGAGAGLGLALCRAVVERHGGTISAHTNEAGGTTITFSLPEADLDDASEHAG